MATQYLDLRNPNCTSEVLSFYLWGQRTPPSKDEIANDRWISREGNIQLTVNANLLLNIVAPLVNVKDFKLTEVFFGGKTALGDELDKDKLNGVSQNSNGEYELTQLA
jgi:hypothetical protein